MKLATRLGIAFAALLLLLIAAVFIAALNAQGGMRGAIAFGGAVAIAVGGLGAWWTVRNVAQSLDELAMATKRIAAGDLTGQFDSRRDNELSALLGDLQLLNERLLRAIGNVRSGTTALAGTSSQVNRDNDILSERTIAQANALQQTAASMEELTATVKHNSDSAQRASELAVGASQTATKGGDVVSQAVRKMSAIQDSSRKISDIVGVIDSIAFQTNILALNAAVEAARAGEQGKGFAVVASEVRVLAQRCATAAKEIKSLISESVAEVDAGSKLVDSAGKTMSEVVASIGNVAEIVNSISEASKEQSLGIDSVNQAMAELDGMTNKNAAMVRAASKTAVSLNEKSVAVLRAVEGFKLGTREYGTADEALAMVKRAIEFAKTHGDDALIADVNKLSQSQFVDRDLYLFVMDVDTANWLAHSNNPRAVGFGADTKDPVTGRLFVREMQQLMKSQGSGWTDYHWQHPITNENQAKSCYMELYGNMGIGCGIHKNVQGA